MPPLNPIERLQRALKQEAKRASLAIQESLSLLARAHAESLSSGAPPTIRKEDALKALAASIDRLYAAADLGGRLGLRYPEKRNQPAPPEDFSSQPEEEIPLVPVVVFEEAVRDLEERDPYGADSLKRAGLEVSDVYGPISDGRGGVFHPHGFALALAADADVASRVKERLVSGLAQGKRTDEVIQDLVTEWDFPQSYAQVITRTNYATATSAGRFREAARVQSAGIPVGFRFSAVMDSDTRPGHAALNGLVASADDPIWLSWTPPLSWNCRCQLESVVGDEVPKTRATVPPGAAKDPGFGRRTDLQGPYRGL